MNDTDARRRNHWVRRIMARRLYMPIMSLDGYVADEAGQLRLGDAVRP
jgi:hypothetical protein